MTRWGITVKDGRTYGAKLVVVITVNGRADSVLVPRTDLKGGPKWWRSPSLGAPADIKDLARAIARELANRPETYRTTEWAKVFYAEQDALIARMKARKETA